jgi:hypothetical protein
MLESSTSLRLGQALVAAARTPGRGSLRLPRELYGLWRSRARSVAPPTATSASTRPTDEGAGDGLHLAHRSVSFGTRRLEIAGVLRPDTTAAIGADAVVNRLLPHDGRMIVERTHPDAVVVQVSACTGTGPWALAGTGAAPDLDRRLHEILGTARASGRAAVLWRDVPLSAAPGLARLGWDAVVELDAGVSPGTRARAGATRTELRRLFVADAIRLRLSAIARTVDAPDPLDERRVTVLAAPGDDADAARLTEQVLRQEHRPSEVLVPRAGRWLTGVAAAGVAVRTGPDARYPWIADWTDLDAERPPTHLLDLVCAQECTGADAVGFVAGATGDDLGDLGAYVFVPTLTPRLTRRSLHRSGMPPDSWSRRGYRLLGIRGDAA